MNPEKDKNGLTDSENKENLSTQKSSPKKVAKKSSKKESPKPSKESFPYRDFINYSKAREDFMSSGKGQIELQVLAKEIDDERTEKDIASVSVLEVGCLNGVAMKILKQQYGIKNIEGIDINPYSPEMCKKHGTKCTQMDIMDLNKKYDIIFMQHLDDKNHDFLAEAITKSIENAKKKVIVILNIFNDKEATDLVRAVPNENHRYIKDIVKYQLGRTHYRVWIIVFYPKDKNINKEEVG